ncbi:hypothetical protein Tco_1294671 [Tanacetum coccineum]
MGRFNFGRTSLTGFPAQSVRSFNAHALDSPYLLVLNTGTSESRQHVAQLDSFEVIRSHLTRACLKLAQAGFPIFICELLNITRMDPGKDLKNNARLYVTLCNFMVFNKCILTNL